MFARFRLPFLFIFNVVVTFSALAEEEPYVVELLTECSLEPLYLLPIEEIDSPFGPGYLQQLNEVLAFDLSHNGSTLLFREDCECDQAAKRLANAQLATCDLWKKRRLPYVVRLEVVESALTTSIVDVAKGCVKTSAPTSLTGNLTTDRQQIHRTADLIQRALFGTEGIATTHLIFAKTEKKSEDSSKWTAEVWEIDYDGANGRQLTFDNAFCVTPVYLPPKGGFTPGGFLYVSYQHGEPKIYLGSLKGGKPQRLITLQGNQLMPAVTRQRDFVAFISDVTGNPDLFLQPFTPEQGARGKPYQIFSASQATQGSPTFSPDGRQIAFVSNKDGSPKIYLMPIPAPGVSLKSIRPTLLTKRNRESSAPAWSPDGNKIAYCARTNGDRQIWVYDLQTRKERQLTEGPGNKENPSWAPNSLHIVYNTSDSNKSNLYFINLNQPDPVMITSGKKEKRFPNWEPR